MADAVARLRRYAARQPLAQPRESRRKEHPASMGLRPRLPTPRPATRATRGKREPSRRRDRTCLRERAVVDPRAAESLLRWLQRPRPMAPEDDALEALSVERFERLQAGAMRLCSMGPVLGLRFRRQRAR